MTTNEILTLMLAFFAGVAIRAAFFGGLWWTALQGVRTRRPALLFLASFLVTRLTRPAMTKDKP